MWNISIAFSKFINSEVICGGLSDKTKESYQRTRDESLDTTKIYTHYTNPELRKIYEKVQEKC